MNDKFKPNILILDFFLNNQGVMYLVFAVGTLALLLFMEFGIHRRENDKAKVLLDSLSEYNNEIERLNDELSMFRHDYLNLLYALKSSIDSKNIDKISNIYYHVLAPTEKYLKTISESISFLHRIKNIEVKSLLSYKINYVRKRGIRFHLSIHDPIFLVSRLI